MSSTSPELPRGTLNIVILGTLSWGPLHGVGVVRWIEEVTHQQLQIEEGALYPALHRLEKKGWLEADWGFTDRGRKVKYHQPTPAGRRQLTEELRTWTRCTRAIGLVIAVERGTSA